MNNALTNICENKRKHIAINEGRHPLSEIKQLCKSIEPPRGFLNALKNNSQEGYGLIAEIKRSSPSKGLIRKDFDPKSLSMAYHSGGATCISVLTDEPYFGGKDRHLCEAKKAVKIPILRKDFMLEPYQIHESRALGADCILLIMAALSKNKSIELEGIANSYGMDVLIEVHNEEELEQALELNSPLIGINNRNLKTLETDISNTKTLSKLVPEEKLIVSESGLNTPEDLAEMATIGVRCFLIGESLMRKKNVSIAVKNLLDDPLKDSS